MTQKLFPIAALVFALGCSGGKDLVADSLSDSLTVDETDGDTDTDTDTDTGHTGTTITSGG